MKILTWKVALLAVLLLTAPALGRGEADARSAWLEGTEAFRRILNDAGLTPLTKLEQLDEAPKQTILIVLGDTDCLASVPGGLERFVRSGGAVLVATDRGRARSELAEKAAQELVNVAGVEISEETLVCDKESACYAGQAFCPILRPAAGATPNLFRNPAVPGGNALRVATNVPSMLWQKRRFPGNLEALANLPAQCKADGGWEWKFAIEGEPLFAVGGALDEGRALVLADHSIFINQMMLPTDNHNVEFAVNCVNYLRQGGQGGARTKALFVDDGLVKTDFNVPLKEVKIPPEKLLEQLFARRQQLAMQADALAAQAQEDNLANRALLDGMVNRGGEAFLFRAALVGLTFVLLGYGLYRVGLRGRHREGSTAPLLPGAVASNVPTASLPEQRYRSMLRARNLGEPAREAARLWFVSRGVGPGAPRVLAQGGWWRRWAFRRRVGWVWQVAYGARLPRVSPAGYRRLLGELQELGAALADGSLRIEDCRSQIAD